MLSYYIKNNIGKIILSFFVIGCISFTFFLSFMAKRADRISLELAQRAMDVGTDNIKY
jgi:hypothetical protein